METFREESDIAGQARCLARLGSVSSLSTPHVS
jgi:hypothetical protein